MQEVIREEGGGEITFTFSFLPENWTTGPQNGDPFNFVVMDPAVVGGNTGADGSKLPLHSTELATYLGRPLEDLIFRAYLRGPAGSPPLEGYADVNGLGQAQGIGLTSPQSGAHPYFASPVGYGYDVLAEAREFRRSITIRAAWPRGTYTCLIGGWRRSYLDNGSAIANSETYGYNSTQFLLRLPTEEPFPDPVDRICLYTRLPAPPGRYTRRSH